MKLHLFQQITELNHSFDELIAGLAKLESIPFFQRELIRHARSDVEIARVYANREFFENFEKIVEDDAKWAYTFQRDFEKKLKTETTSTSKSGIRNKGGSGKNCPHESSSFPIGIGLTKTVMTRSTRSGERSLCSRVIGRLEPRPRSREERLGDQLPLGPWPKEESGHEKGHADQLRPSSIRSW